MPWQEALKYEADPDYVNWDRAYPEIAHADRLVGKKRTKSGSKNAEYSGSTYSNRVQDVDRRTNLLYRLESGLEADALSIFRTDPSVVFIQAQYGPVFIKINGQWHKRVFDFCVRYSNRSRALFAVRDEEHSEEIAKELELFRNQELHKHADFAVLLTERKISKPAVYRAQRILRGLRMNNENNNKLVMQTLLKMGGYAKMGIVLLESGIAPAHAEDAVWSLIGLGLIEHDHPNARNLKLSRYSPIYVVEGASHEYA